MTTTLSTAAHVRASASRQSHFRPSVQPRTQRRLRRISNHFVPEVSEAVEKLQSDFRAVDDLVACNSSRVLKAYQKVSVWVACTCNAIEYRPKSYAHNPKPSFRCESTFKGWRTSLEDKLQMLQTAFRLPPCSMNPTQLKALVPYCNRLLFQIGPKPPGISAASGRHYHMNMSMSSASVVGSLC